MNSPRTKQFGKFLLVLFALVSVLTLVAFAEGDEAAVSQFYGTIWSLLPPVVAIVLALITKEVYSSLFIGILVGFVLQANFDPVMTFNRVVLCGALSRRDGGHRHYGEPQSAAVQRL